MPTFPLPFGGSSLAGGDLPVSDAADYLAELPPEYAAPDNAPIRDAFAEAFAEGWLEYQRLAEQAAAQRDKLRAVGGYLTLLGSESDIPRGAGEPDAVYRPRLLSTPKIVTPEAIYQTVKGVISAYTDIAPTVLEPEMDGWFATDGTSNSGFVGEDPQYLDRLYEADAALNEGVFVEGVSPGGLWVSDGASRRFAVRIPSLESADEDHAFVFGPSATFDTDEVNVFFIGDGTDASGSESDGSVATSVFANRLSTQQIYNTVISTVDAIKGQGMTWMLLVDPLLE